MLGRVGAFLLLAALAAPYSPLPVTEDAEAGAFDALVRVFEYSGLSKQERPLVLTQDEAYDTYYFTMEADDFILVDGWEEGDGALGAAQVQVKRAGTSDVLCEGLVFHILHDGNKHLKCDGINPQTHYVVVYINTFSAEIQMWGKNDHTPIGN